MKLRALPVLLLALAACGRNEAGVQGATDIAREVTTAIRSNARVQVSVKASAEEPTPADLALRKQLEDRIEAENIGRLISSGGGAGFVDVVVEVENTAQAIPRIQEILKSMDAARDASFRVFPGAN